MTLGEKLRGVLERARTFLRNRDANVAMMFAISLIPVTIAAGAGLDLARAMIVKSNLSEALDAAALAAASTTGLTKDQMTARAQSYFNANYNASAAYGTPATITLTQSGQSITVTSSVPMPTTLIGAAGIRTVNVTASSTVVWGQNKLWVSLVLDNTGSMSETDSSGTSKLTALKNATGQLLTMLQGASTTVGDVRVALIPFSKDVNVGTGNAGATWIDWTDWETAPASAPSTSVGPGSSCPWSYGTNGFACQSSATNDPNCYSGWGSSCAGTIPSSGLICPSQHSSGNGLGGHYYNGCYNSVPTKTKTTTDVDTTPVTLKQTCSQTGSGAITCTDNSGYPQDGTTSSTSSNTTTSGYTGDSVTTTSSTATNSTSDGTKRCTGFGSSRKCTWTRTISQTRTDTTVTKVGVGPWNHTWVKNDHTTWTGCIMDRTQNYDTNTTAPTTTATRFPAENSVNCLASTIVPLGYDWTALNNAVTAMSAAGSTNQTVGLAWGMHALTSGDPLNAPTLPANTKQYIIIISDGLNTINRWSGNGSAHDTNVDDRMALACTNAKSAGYTIYAIFIDLGGTQGNSDTLQACASDASKYFDLTTNGALLTTLNAIGQQITNLRVAM